MGTYMIEDEDDDNNNTNGNNRNGGKLDAYDVPLSGTREHTYGDRLKDKILNVLDLYPQISPTMLQCGIGPSVKSYFWRPILEEMIRDGLVVREYRSYCNAIGQHRTAEIIRNPRYVNPLDIRDEVESIYADESSLPIEVEDGAEDKNWDKG